MRYPVFIKVNDVIGFVSPSFGCGIEPYKTAFGNAVNIFNKMGYRTDIGYNCYKTDGTGISTDPESCGREFTEYYCSPGNRALISCGGGELMCEILEYVDFEKITGSEPKWFMGYSDNTNLTFLLTTICDTASVYAPCAAAFGMEPWHKSIEDAFSIITGEKAKVSNYDKWERESLKSPENPLAPYNTTEDFKIIVYMGNKRLEEGDNQKIYMEGRLLGGCLDCLSNLVGTKYDKVREFVEKYKNDGIIWFLESCDLNVMAIRRAMWQLENSGWFKYTKGFIIGRPYCHGQEIMGLNQYDAVIGVAGRYNVPVIMDADIGHLAPMMPLVTGSVAEISAVSNTVTVNMKYI